MGCAAGCPRGRFPVLPAIQEEPRSTYDTGRLLSEFVTVQTAIVLTDNPQAGTEDSLWKESIAANLRGIINTGWRFPRGHMRRPPPAQKTKARGETEALPWISEVSEISTYSHNSVSRIEVRQDNNSTGTVSLVSFSKWRR
ncbi:Hypp5073 [Branchiostoma lanceolatum]|uniref:Hypp5073 protein n=1 Tax=Branchiostoma lanceolatum TaxID=7740 RepID=A0A8K0F3D8_BRALA|nr:Hypp5073 [Branchiostoma lanceolatum]